MSLEEDFILMIIAESFVKLKSTFTYNPKFIMIDRKLTILIVVKILDFNIYSCSSQYIET